MGGGFLNRHALQSAVAGLRVDALGRGRAQLVQLLGFVAGHALAPLCHRSAVVGLGLVLVGGGVVALLVLLGPCFGHRRIDLGLVGHGIDLFVRRKASVDQPLRRHGAQALLDLFDRRRESRHVRAAGADFHAHDHLGVAVGGELGVVVLIVKIGALWVEKSLYDNDLRARTLCVRTVYVSC
jgi:hypothetical protein